MKGWTLQSLIDGRMTLTAYCQRSECNRSQRLDLSALRARFGPDAPAMADDLKPKLKCGKCGGKAVGLIYSPSGNDERYPKYPR